MKSECRIEFLVTGFSESPEKVMQRLGIEKARSWKIGDRRTPKSTLCHAENGFSLGANFSDHEFDEHLVKLLKVLHPHQTTIAILKASCQLVCVFYLVGSERPTINFSKESLSQLAQLETSIDIDVYYLADAGTAQEQRLRITTGTDEKHNNHEI